MHSGNDDSKTDKEEATTNEKGTSDGCTSKSEICPESRSRSKESSPEETFVYSSSSNGKEEIQEEESVDIWRHRSAKRVKINSSLKGSDAVGTSSMVEEEHRMRKISMSASTNSTAHRFSAQSMLFSSTNPTAIATNNNNTADDGPTPNSSSSNNNNQTLLSTATMPFIMNNNMPYSMRVLSPLLFLSSPYGCCANSSCRLHTESVFHTDKEKNDTNGNLECLPAPTAAPTVASMLQTDNSSPIVQLFQTYYSACALYNCSPNAGVLAAIRFSLPSLRVSGSFHDADMLALSEIFISNTAPLLHHVKRLDFSRASQEGKLHGIKGFKSHGAFALSRILQRSQHIEEVFLPRHKIGPYGAAAIFAACQYNPTVKVLVLRRCLLGVRGAEAFAKAVVSSKHCGLREVDLSNCRLGYHGTNAICNALLKREKCGLSPINVDLEGNLIFQEIMNSVTHGLGILFALMGTVALTERTKGQPVRTVVACAIYSTSLLFLYTCSTLFHSFFALRTMHLIFGIFDHCAIYILIAGSYTPYLAISLSDKPLWSVYLLSFIWICCFLGICVEAFYQTWKYKGQFSLAMYVGMGWSAVVCIPDLIVAIPKEATYFLVLGGIGYTTGVPFFVRNTNLDHSIWHMFVLVASVFHWIGVYCYVALL